MYACRHLTSESIILFFACALLYSHIPHLVSFIPKLTPEKEMDDFIELGIEAVDKCVDKHFHKLPDKALHSETYHPRNIKNAISGQLRGNGPAKDQPVNSSDGLGADEIGSDDSTLDEKRYRRQENGGRQSLDKDQRRAYGPDYVGGGRICEDGSASPRYRDAIYGQALQPSYKDSSSPSHHRKRGNDDLDRNLQLRYHQNHTGQNLRRMRSLPYDEPRTRDMTSQSEHEDTKEYSKNRRRFTVDESRNSPREQTSKSMSKSSNKTDSSEAGLRYGVVGAMIGGLAAQELTARNGRGGSNDKMALAMIGAVVGALAGKSFGERVHENKGRAERKPREDRYEREYNTNPEY
ncbi:hypothetical protein NHQ30_009253 [Ciborinia camelliae]|nr:hypothetical protein NHQ30_009253 [Ciborinia camelliae]